MTKSGLMVGLEIHQQLATGRKLFCNCKPTESEEYDILFQRRLRVAKSETGKRDNAALFERSKDMQIEYHGNSHSSCLVEQDEEPPHELDSKSLDLALIIAASMNSKIFTEIYPMRKMVIDGSNTSGFQRTMLVSQGGTLQYMNGKSIRVQAICLEEDAAKNLGTSGTVRRFGLDRLGIPLLEIALEPSNPKNPQEVREIALSVGRLLRSTNMVARGIGTIRQDVNISVDGGNVVEVKGVQQLEQLEKVIEFEEKRQMGMISIAEKIKTLKTNVSQDTKIITEIMKNCQSKIIKKSLEDGCLIRAIKINNGKGIFGFSPYPDIRLGSEIAQVVRFFGVGGIFHSDELPKHGIEEEDVNRIKDILGVKENDGWLMVAIPSSKDDIVTRAIINRFNLAEDGVPAETRLATPTGSTIFLRPRPGAARMYPETDIHPIAIKDRIEFAKKNIPKSWDQILRELQGKYQLNTQLAEQILDSSYYLLFEKICENKKCPPNFVASTLCSTITNLERKGLKSSLLHAQIIIDCFNKFAKDIISKESIELIFENIMQNKTQTVNDAMDQLNLSSKIDIDKMLNDLVQSNIKMIKEQKERATSPLMGMIMKQARGKISGQIINEKLKELIKKNL